MTNISTKIALGCVIVLMLSSMASAEILITGAWDRGTLVENGYDRGVGSYSSTGTAPGYGAAWHTTDDWQRLGDSSTANDGVSWSVDGGLTWGTTEALHRGSTVHFRYDFQRTNDGIHTYDQLKSWIDWDGDKQWDASEQIIGIRWDQWDWETLGTTAPTGSTFNNSVRNDRFVDMIQEFFIAEVNIPLSATLGDSWMRTRVHCNHESFGRTSPYGLLTQGEVEDYMVVIASPEPSTFILLGAGLLGLAYVARRRNRASAKA